MRTIDKHNSSFRGERGDEFHRSEFKRVNCSCEAAGLGVTKGDSCGGNCEASSLFTLNLEPSKQGGDWTPNSGAEARRR